MALDIKAMKAALANVQKKGNDNIWKPEEGPNEIRIVPLTGSPDNPFQILHFHYGLGGKTYLSPITYGERDPIAEFSDELVGEGNLSKEDYKAAKKFYPQARTYLPIVVRGKEKEGVKFWAFGKKTYEDLLLLMTNDEYGDITDVESGTDLTVHFTPAEKSETKFAETKITARRKTSALTNDNELLHKLLNDQPTLLDQFKRHSYEDLKEVLMKVLNVQSTENTTESAPSSAPAASEAPKAETPKASISKEVEDEFNSIFNS